MIISRPCWVMQGESEKDMKEIKCTIWKLGNRLYRITVNDIRYRKLDTSCISDIGILFDCMEDIKNVLEKEQNANVVFETLDNSREQAAG